MQPQHKRVSIVLLSLPAILLGALVGRTNALSAAPLLAPRPGPIEHPLSIASAAFDRDGFADLAIADFQAGTIQILLNRHDGTFAPERLAPFNVGAASFSALSVGPFDLAVTDLNPED